ncbi:hypothetical protein [Brumimicrobium salinarum]|nr:hypothetical protein [Brumimicrobium salinarum]
MIKRTNNIVILLFIFSYLLIGSCASSNPGATYATVEEAEAARAKDKKAAAKAQKKAQKENEKRYWKMQSKAAKKRIRKTRRRNKKEKRKKRGCIF